MIAWWWLIISFFIGTFFGIFFTAIVTSTHNEE